MEEGFEGAEPNFRQVGTRTGGRLLVGTTNSHNTAKAGASSIPSKFETILYSGATEVDGFASRVARFKPNSNDLPGAGTYHKPATFVNNSDSISKKGYGNGFVSKTDRFFVVNQSGAPAYFPGPGSYDSVDFLTHKNRGNYNRSESTANFKDHDAAPLVAPNRAVPGPGEYNQEVIRRKRRSRRERVPKTHSKHRYNQDHGYGPQGGRVNKTVESESNQSFGRVDSRFKDASTDVPAPGQYNPEGGPGAQWAPNNYPSANFNSKSERDPMGTNKADVPGPAHYNPNEKEETDREAMDTDGYKVFKKGQIDRFGKPLVRRKPLDNYPGPGTYEASETFGGGPEYGDGSHRPHTRPRVNGGARGGFTYATRKRFGGTPHQTTASISASLMHDIIAGANIKPPGPAYYNPDVVSNSNPRSYHLNMKQKWV